MPLTFDPSASKPSRSNAVLLGDAAATAYQSDQACKEWAARNGFDSCETFFGRGALIPSDTQGFVAANAQDVVVAFRGTEPKQPLDWLADVRFKLRDWGHGAGRVHDGFQDALRAVWGNPAGAGEVLPKSLRQAGARRVWITGHSLGGALAELCAARAAAENLPLHGVYTFGQPRVGDADFADAVHGKLGSRVLRFINDRDIVPRVPLFTLKFHHYGHEVFFDKDGNSSEPLSAVEKIGDAVRLLRSAFQRDASGLFGRLRDFVEDTLESGDHRDAIRDLLKEKAENITDHDMRRSYLPRLGA